MPAPGGSGTGPSPVDHGRPGVKRRRATDRDGIRLSVRLTSDNIHDSRVFERADRCCPRSGLDTLCHSTPESCEVAVKLASGSLAPGGPAECRPAERSDEVLDAHGRLRQNTVESRPGGTDVFQLSEGAISAFVRNEMP